MTPDDLKVIEALVAIWPDNLSRNPQNDRGTCVETTKFAGAALTALGVANRPWPCEVWAGNAKAVELAKAGVTVDAWPPDAWSIGILPEAASLMDRQPTKSGSAQFHGHLVIAGDDWMLDLTAPQFSRPDKGIAIDGASLAWGTPPLFDEKPTILVHDLPDGGIVQYRSRLELASWRRTEAWRQVTPPTLIDRICSVVLAHLRETA